MFTKILVPISANSLETLLPQAIETAQQHNAGIVALHVMDYPVPYLATPVDCDLGMVYKALDEHAQMIVSRAEAMLSDYSGHAEASMLRVPAAGVTVGQAIASYAAQSRVDLIVVGERQTAWWKFMDEDVAAILQRRCNVPIQIMPRAAAKNAPASPLKYVLASRPGTAIKPPVLE